VPVSRVLVIDDDEEDRSSTRMHLEDHGLDVIAPDRRYTTVEELVGYVTSQHVDVTICDHRLQPRQLAPFYGAQAVAELVQRSQVAVLVTGYADMDFDTSIRTYRAHIPALLRREQLQEPEALDEVVSAVRGEMAGIIPPDRRLWQTVLRVGDVSEEGALPVLDVFIPGWRPAHAVRMPSTLLPPSLRADIAQLHGRFLLAEVNIGASEKEDLFFGRVEGLADPAEWPATVTGQGVDPPVRDDAPRGLFRDQE
jgi:CheY-like chemotaxis protein